MATILRVVMIVCLIGICAPSWADIYGYEDENGILHFTNCPRDPQFKIYIQNQMEKGGEIALPSAGSASCIPADNNYDSLISKVSEKYQMDFALVKAIIRAESGFNPIAVSRKGAKGLMQLMPATASRVNVSNPFNPEENVEGGVRHFKYLLSVFNNDVRLSLAAYNAGEDIVSKLGAIPPYRETTDYVRKVLYFYQLNKGQEVVLSQ